MARLDELRAKYETVPRAIDGPLRERMRALRRYDDPSRIEHDVPNVKVPLWGGAVLLAACIPEYFVIHSYVTGILGIFALVAAASRKGEHERALRRSLEALASTGDLVLARIVIANTQLWEGTTKILPAAVVFSHDPARRFDREWLTDLSEHLNRLRASESCPKPEEEAIWKFIRNDFATGCIKIPPSTCGNDLTFLADLILDPAALPQGKILDPFIPAIADADRQRPLWAALLQV